ncbi:MAG: 1-acyl-sn-glycerol-3-phosphate acyltransferase [Zoogloeaceae bacterium]|jgi:1-acyl-sn-glycerol-3-phosphate acyltransferase|nr:1-acyl-sn-glycerol-3-phosphate acyltransferase [Zoogloeaceae bacterium]
MPDRLPRILRILATGFCFVVFGLGGLVILCCVFPLLRLFYPDRQTSQRHARRIIHHSFRFFVWLMVVCGTISYEVRQVERLGRSGLLIIANHPSLIDVVLLIALVKQPNCVVKASLRDNIFTRGPVLSAGFVVNMDGSQLVEDCIASVRSGDHLVIFPEGTRSVEHNGKLNPLKRGAANIALRGQLAITPVIITVSEPMLGKGQRWYDAPKKKPHFVLSVEDDISTATYITTQGTAEQETAPTLATRALSNDLNTFFTRGIQQQCSN